MRPETPPDDGDSTFGGLGRALQGMVLDSLAVGVVLLGLVAVAAGFLEATGAARVLAVVVGLGVIGVTATGWRRQWSDRVMWAAVLGCDAAAVGAFVVAVS